MTAISCGSVSMLQNVSQYVRLMRSYLQVSLCYVYYTNGGVILILKNISNKFRKESFMY